MYEGFSKYTLEIIEFVEYSALKDELLCLLVIGALLLSMKVYSKIDTWKKSK